MNDWRLVCIFAWLLIFMASGCKNVPSGTSQDMLLRRKFADRSPQIEASSSGFDCFCGGRKISTDLECYGEIMNGRVVCYLENVSQKEMIVNHMCDGPEWGLRYLDGEGVVHEAYETPFVEYNLPHLMVLGAVREDGTVSDATSVKLEFQLPKDCARIVKMVLVLECMHLDNLVGDVSLGKLRDNLSCNTFIVPVAWSRDQR